MASFGSFAEGSGAVVEVMEPCLRRISVPRQPLSTSPLEFQTTSGALARLWHSASFCRVSQQELLDRLSLEAPVSSDMHPRHLRQDEVLSADVGNLAQPSSARGDTLSPLAAGAEAADADPRQGRCLARRCAPESLLFVLLSVAAVDDVRLLYRAC